MRAPFSKTTGIVLGWVGLCFLLLGCATPEDGPSSEATPDVAAAAPQPVNQLPISLNEVMVALVNHAADPIWVAAWHSPESDADWRELERLAYQLEVAGALLTIPGSGPLDEQWASDPQWREFARQLREAGGSAVAAVEARDHAAISAAGDEIVEICEACHARFKPDLPTGGKFGEISPNEADLEGEEP